MAVASRPHLHPWVDRGELHEMRLEMQRPVENQTTAEAESDPLQESLDALRDDVVT
jgi:hypothetical protein